MNKDELESKCEGSSLTSEDIQQIFQNQEDATKYRQLKEKMKQVEDESYLLDRLDACDTSGAVEVLREFLSDK
ncbi:hypothetical protein [Candidatus Nitrosopumilus sediminis]|uniref:Uncharacterized protein n=1 Tax=Candidatus Nitrosopumilus sediminis TaxID=1229909 RepID=K0BCC7_9ARCH|nr:hypothetical protein [Candidatus Nitrosopumilus sediminis]AFS83129.1 hypothetical protein NSED_06655 [Candidatus Nitrosopumilus sediminis]